MRKYFVSIILIFAILLTNFSVYASTSDCGNYCSSSGAHYYVFNKNDSYNYNELLGKVNLSNINIDTVGKRNGFISLGFGRKDQDSFIDISIQFKDGGVYLFAYGRSDHAPKIWLEKKIGNYANGFVTDINYIDMYPKLKREGNKDYVYLNFDVFDKNWVKTTHSFKKDITGYFTYNSHSDIYLVRPYHFTSLVPKDYEGYENDHTDGSYLKKVVFLVSKKDTTAGLIPFDLSEAYLDMYCRDNITVKQEKENYMSQKYTINIENQ